MFLSLLSFFSKELFTVISNAIRCSVTCFGVVSSHEAVPLFVVLPPPLFSSFRQTKSNNLRGRKSKPRRLLVVYGMLNTSVVKGDKEVKGDKDDRRCPYNLFAVEFFD